MSDQIILTPEEQDRLDVINALIEKKLTNGEAAKKLGTSVRQVQRLKKVVQARGAGGVIHGLKGKVSNHHIDTSVKEKVLQRIRSRYDDFKPGFATEKITEDYHIAISSKTIRFWMSEEGLWKPRTHRKQGTYRSWRPRKEYYGEFEQFDGCYHYWFEHRYADREGNPIEVCLLASIDDATGKITLLEFVEHEGVIPVFRFWRGYILVNGKPIAIYMDSYSTYKVNHKSAVDNKDLITQFQRAMRTLNINPIIAHSAEAKGRVERLFLTLQDRLVKEMRLAGMNNPHDGTIFVRDIFIPKFNQKFSVIPAKTGDVHRSCTQIDQDHLNRIFSVQSHRIINNDFTIQFKHHWYQLKEIQSTTIRPKEMTLVEEWLDGTMHLSIREKELNYFLLPEKPQKIKTNPVILTNHPLNWKPPADHPWRRYRDLL